MRGYRAAGVHKRRCHLGRTKKEYLPPKREGGQVHCPPPPANATTTGRVINMYSFYQVPNHQFAKYQVTKAAPWWFKRYVFFQRDAVLEPLYKSDYVDPASRRHDSPNVSDMEKA